MKSEFIKKARENLEAADILFEKKLFNAATNRAYYSAFQTAIAALIEFQLVSEKNEHRWVQATFSNELIRKRKLYPNRIKPYLLEMQRNRNTADYKELGISQTIAKRQLNKAKEFFSLISKEAKT